MDKKWDVIVIGGGPAGLTAAIYTVRKGLTTLLITKDIGGQAALSGNVENYLGFTMITGWELAQKFREHIEKFEHGNILEGVAVTNITGSEGNWCVLASNGQNYWARALIIASGRRPRLLGVPGEKEFLGRGVATCATCDAPLFKDKDVAVIGGGNSAMDAVVSLAKVARKVYVVNINPALTGDEVLKRSVESAPNVTIFPNSVETRVIGDKTVTAVEIENLKTKKRQVLKVSGVFVEIGYIPAVEFDNLTKKDGKGAIITDCDTMATSVPGIFAAGDVNNIWGEQIIIAAGEGAKAGLRVAEYLAKLPQVTSKGKE